ncbi:LysR substrate-binding domain-containing protein [Viridibacterium curvum]|uniref:LysR substrate-binding domain-containing protein n=1 Tax=Viridibacterium curvum TaxID=1101404 RepID=A0ABP9R2U4_9RHOO
MLSARQTREDSSGLPRIVGPRSVLHSVISSVLEERCRLYPEMQTDIQLDDSIGNWVKDRLDVGFRLGASPQEGLIARRLFTMQLITCAAPPCLRKLGVPQTSHALKGASLQRVPQSRQRTPRSLAHEAWRQRAGLAGTAQLLHK